VEDLELAVEAARLAGSVASQWFRRPLEVTVKGAPANVVTEADTAAEHAVRDLLLRERPADGLLGEEGSSRPGARRWLVDAIDGTLNFTRDDPFWCSAVALEDADGALVCAVHHVASGETFSASRGGGCRLDGERLRLGPGRPLEECVLATYLHPGDASRPRFHRALEAVATSRVRGSGSLELAWVAAGRLDVWLQRDVLPWDWVPGALLVAEAGGTSVVVDQPDGRWHAAGSVLAVQHLSRILG
jgi:myo-inositol-1(or 4)-monophosphatase